MKVQVSLMYLASGGSKLLDPDWRGGLMMRGMVASFARLVQSRGVPSDWIASLETPVGAGLLARGAIATELTLAVALWWPPSRRLALWVGVLFHLSISLMTPVLLFTAEMLLVYLAFVDARPGSARPALRPGARSRGEPRGGVRLARTLPLRAGEGRDPHRRGSGRDRAPGATGGGVHLRDDPRLLPGLAGGRPPRARPPGLEHEGRLADGSIEPSP